MGQKIIADCTSGAVTWQGMTAQEESDWWAAIQAAPQPPLPDPTALAGLRDQIGTATSLTTLVKALATYLKARDG